MNCPDKPGVVGGIWKFPGGGKHSVEGFDGLNDTAEPGGEGTHL